MAESAAAAKRSPGRLPTRTPADWPLLWARCAK